MGQPALVTTISGANSASMATSASVAGDDSNTSQNATPTGGSQALITSTPTSTPFGVFVSTVSGQEYTLTFIASTATAATQVVQSGSQTTQTTSVPPGGKWRRLWGHSCLIQNPDLTLDLGAVWAVPSPPARFPFPASAIVPPPGAPPAPVPPPQGSEKGGGSSSLGCLFGCGGAGGGGGSAGGGSLPCIIDCGRGGTNHPSNVQDNGSSDDNNKQSSQKDSSSSTQNSNDRSSQKSTETSSQSSCGQSAAQSVTCTVTLVVETNVASGTTATVTSTTSQCGTTSGCASMPRTTTSMSLTSSDWTFIDSWQGSPDLISTSAIPADLASYLDYSFESMQIAIGPISSITASNASSSRASATPGDSSGFSTAVKTNTSQSGASSQTTISGISALQVIASVAANATGVTSTEAVSHSTSSQIESAANSAPVAPPSSPPPPPSDSCTAQYQFSELVDAFTINGKNFNVDTQLGGQKGRNLYNHVNKCVGLERWNFRWTGDPGSRWDWIATGYVSLGQKSCLGSAVESIGGQRKGCSGPD